MRLQAWALKTKPSASAVTSGAVGAAVGFAALCELEALGLDVGWTAIALVGGTVGAFPPVPGLPVLEVEAV